MNTSFLQHIWQFILFLIILLGPVPLCFWLVSIAQSKRCPPGLAHNLLAILTYWCGIQTFIALFLGVVEHFFLIPVLILELIIFSFGIVLLVFFGGHSRFFYLRELFEVKQPFNKAESFVAASILLAGIILIAKLSSEVIINYDSLWYHLPTMARWYQEGKFVQLDEFSKTGDWATDAITYYPFNWEILCTLFVMPFQEDFLVTLPNISSWAILGLSVYLLSVKAGAKRFYAIAATSLVLTIPLIIQHINSLHIDLPFAAFLLAGLYFAIAYSQSRSAVDLSAFLVAIGMLLGIKLSSVGYAAFPIAVLLLLEIKNAFSRKTSLRREEVLQQSKFAVPIIITAASSSLFIGLYWYLKNFIEIGNPLGDIQVSLAGVLLFPGSMKVSVLQQTSLANLFHWTNLSHWKTLVLQAIVRLQLPFVVLFLQALLLPKLFLSKQFSCNRFILGIYCFVFIGTGYLYWKTPFTGTNLLPPLPPQPLNQYIGQQARFAIPFMGMMGVIAAATASSLSTFKYGVVIVVFASSLLGILSSTVFDVVRISTAFKGGVGWASAILDKFGSNPAEAMSQLMGIVGGSVIDVITYITMYIIVFVVFVQSASLKHLGKSIATRIGYALQKSHRVVVISTLLGLLMITSWGIRERRDIERREVYGGVYEYIGSNLKPSETLGYLLSYRSYLLYGKHWNQKVLYIPSNSTLLSQWLDDLQKRAVTVVAVGPLEEKMGWEHREINWLENSKEESITSYHQAPRKVFGQDPKKEIAIYRL